MATDDYTIELDEGMALYNAASQRAFDRIAAMRLDLDPPHPLYQGREFDGRMPSNVASMRTPDLADYYSVTCLWADFVNSRLTQAKALLANADQIIELTKAKVRRSKSGAAAEKEDAVRCDTRYVEANGNWLEAKIHHDLLAHIAESAQRDLRFISRIIETKKLEVEMGRRDNAVRRPPPNLRGR